MREIVLDTETTGLDADKGHRIVEIGAVELVNHLRTGDDFHFYINPERSMPPEAFRVHGLGDAFLRDKPKFHQIVDRFLAFLGDAPLVIHNAAFDMAMINAELRRLGRAPLPIERAVDTVHIARRQFPGAHASLDALCKRFGVDNTGRTKHGALLDSELLADVYLELMGGRQRGLGFGGGSNRAGVRGAAQDRPSSTAAHRRRPAPLPPRLTAAEAEAHADFIADIGEHALWHAKS
ncbi:MAG: DNA polymerase III subunit epsilon [Pseudomonadota bacterium]